MFVLGFGSSCRKIGANPGLMSVWRLSRGTNCPGPECGAKSQAQTGLPAGARSARRHAASANRFATSHHPHHHQRTASAPLLSAPVRVAKQTASRHRTNAPQHANSGKRYVRYLKFGELEKDTAALHHALEARPQSLIYPPTIRPSFWLPLVPVLLGWEWAQTECEVIAQMPLLVPTKHWQPCSQHGSCFCSPSPSAVVWAMPTTRRGVSQCSATTAPPRDLVRAW